MPLDIIVFLSIILYHGIILYFGIIVYLGIIVYHFIIVYLGRKQTCIKPGSGKELPWHNWSGMFSRGHETVKRLLVSGL